MTLSHAPADGRPPTGGARGAATSRARIETIIESMADGLVAVDAERNVLAFNREAQQLTGLIARRSARAGRSRRSSHGDERQGRADPTSRSTTSVPGSIAELFIQTRRAGPRSRSR